MIIGILQEIKNKDIVVVGGFNEYLRGIKDTFKDIDLVVTDFNEIPFKNHIQYSKVRRLYEYGDIHIEVFLRERLPEYEYVKDFKCATIKSMLEFVSKFNHRKSQEIYKRLKRWQQLQ